MASLRPVSSRQALNWIRCHVRSSSSICQRIILTTQNCGHSSVVPGGCSAATPRVTASLLSAATPRVTASLLYIANDSLPWDRNHGAEEHMLHNLRETRVVPGSYPLGQQKNDDSGGDFPQTRPLSVDRCIIPFAGNYGRWRNRCRAVHSYCSSVSSAAAHSYCTVSNAATHSYCSVSNAATHSYRSVSSTAAHSYCSVSSAAAQNRDAAAGTTTAAASHQGATIKQLRQRTGAPIVEVKSVLVNCGWDMDAAYTELRKKGLIAAGKKASRVAAEGLLGVSVDTDAKTAVVVEINSETDFVSRNARFQDLVTRTVGRLMDSASALSAGDSPAAAGALVQNIPLQSVEEYDVVTGSGTKVSIRESVAEVAALTGENVKLRQAFLMRTEKGVISHYLHNVAGPGLSRIVGLVALSGGGDENKETEGKLRSFGQKLAMHVVASRPQFLEIADITEEILNQEREILRSQAAVTGKPKAVIEKMVEGRMRKFYEDVVFMEQKFVMDESKKVRGVIEEMSRELGATIHVEKFRRVQCGEGIEKQSNDFATEVAAQAGGLP